MRFKAKVKRELIAETQKARSREKALDRINRIYRIEAKRLKFISCHAV
jgi:hypothetical protein